MKNVWFRSNASRTTARAQRSRKIKWISVAGTIVVHAALLCLLSLSPNQRLERDSDRSPIEVEMLAQYETEIAAKTESGPAPSSAAPRTIVPQLNANLAIAPSFRPHFGAEVAAHGEAVAAPKKENDQSQIGDPSSSSQVNSEQSNRARGSSVDGSDYIDDPKAEWGSGGGDFGRVADFLRFDRLYRMVDSRLSYPSILAYHGISGTVNARLVITKQGCDWKDTQISASEPHLRVYILDVLQATCRQNLAEFARADRLSNVDFSFTFAQTEHNDSGLIAGQKKIVGNVLLFYRNSHASIAEWKLGPIRGLFPIPAVAVDFVWLKENWDKFVGSPDPMAKFKERTAEPAS